MSDSSSQASASATTSANTSATPSASTSSTATERLAALEARLRHDLDQLELPVKSWVPPLTSDGQQVLDVAIIGGGQAGLAVAATLNHIGVQSVIFDQAPEGYEGPWVTTARMETLRSPKSLSGPSLGFAALTYRAWHEAQYGIDSWQTLDKISGGQWMDYLRWYRRVLKIDVRNDHRIDAILPRNTGLVELRIGTPAGPQSVLARRVVLATGRDGLGGAYLPSLADNLPGNRWVHSADRFDYSSLAGKRVGLIGGGSSAMDSAGTALEAGAASVDLLIRRKELPRINKGKGSGNPGLTFGHKDLPDEWKWRIRHYINVQQTPPPHDSVLRVSRHANARFIFSAAATDVAFDGKQINVTTPRGTFDYDFLIFATGFRMNWAARPEFATIAPHIRSWGDRYTPPPGQEDAELSAAPDLGPGFEFQEKTKGSLPGLERIHCFCFPATLSHGAVSGDIPAISEGAERLAQAIASELYREDVAIHYDNLERHADPELLGDEWTPATLDAERVA